MIGAIIGDIVGSVYEWNRIKTKSFEFFNDKGFVTDDSVCTAAVADALLHDRAPAAALQEWCRRYPNASYGGSFRSWIWMDPPRPYNSFGNGAAMRVSPAAYLNRDALSAALEASDLVTAVTHDHPEGLKGARATTHAIWLAFQGEPAAAIRSTIAAAYGYDLSRTVDDIRPATSSTRSARPPCPKPSPAPSNPTASKTPSATPSPSAATPTPSPPSPAPSPKPFTASPPTSKPQTETRYVPADILRTVREMYETTSS